MKTTVIFHSADFNGLFCREIARKFLPDAELIGWDYGDPKIPFPDGEVYLLDLSPDCFIEFLNVDGAHNRLVWIDHHKTAFEKYHMQNKYGAGHRIDGVAACRLAWQFFTYFKLTKPFSLPEKQAYVDRIVEEPHAVRLAGEYDIWDKRDPDAELFQHGLRTVDLSGPVYPSIDKGAGSTWWYEMLRIPSEAEKAFVGPTTVVHALLRQGRYLEFARKNEYAEVIKLQGFDVSFEGLRFLACNSHRLDIRSHLFEAGIRPEHDGLMGFTWAGKNWSVSLYHAPGKEHHDLSKIAVKYGGGGHRGACGFATDKFPFVTL